MKNIDFPKTLILHGWRIIPPTNRFFLFREIFEFVKEESNIPLDIIDSNEYEDGGINFYIRYTGPLGGPCNNKSVKVDISRSEQLVFKPVMKTVFIGYSDLEQYQLLCYPLEEVFFSSR